MDFPPGAVCYEWIPSPCPAKAIPSPTTKPNSLERHSRGCVQNYLCDSRPTVSISRGSWSSIQLTWGRMASLTQNISLQPSQRPFSSAHQNFKLRRLSLVDGVSPCTTSQHPAPHSNVLLRRSDRLPVFHPPKLGEGKDIVSLKSLVIQKAQAQLVCLCMWFPHRVSK